MRRLRNTAVAVALAGLCVVGFLGQGPASAAKKGAKSDPSTTSTTASVKAANSHATIGHDLTPAPSSCPAQNTCVTLPGTTTGPEAESGGTVDVGPTQNLGVNQWVYINTYGFTPSTELHVDWCTDSPSVALANQQCLSQGYPLIANTNYAVVSLADGTESLSYQVLEIDDSDNPFNGVVPGTSTQGTFFCNATHPCSVNITSTGIGDQGDQTMSAANTAVIPITFAVSGNGCGSSAESVNSESEYGIEFLLQIAANASCSLPNPSIAFNTDADGPASIQGLSNGSAEVAFTDDPEGPDQQATLSTGNYKLIPVALTANIIGFKAQESQSGTLFPLNAFNLSPLMVAGLLTGAENTPIGADIVSCKTASCPVPPCVGIGKKAPTSCGLFNMANFQTSFNFPQQFESFVRSDSSGSNGLLYEWLCKAPNATVPVSIGSVSESITEPITAAQELEDLFATGTSPLKTCPIYDQLPPESLTSPVKATGYNDPNQQEIKMNNFVAPGLQGASVNAAFSAINWSEGRYYGLRVASLQNASGAYVQPTQASLDAAVADATTNADGSISPDYATKDATAYPMPSVVYAAVCADPQPDTQVKAISDMLTQLLAVSGPNATETLPQGFVPLTSSLASEAQTDIGQDLVGGGSAPLTSCPPTTATTTTTTTTATATPTTAPSSGAATGSGGSSGGGGVTQSSGTSSNSGSSTSRNVAPTSRSSNGSQQVSLQPAPSSQSTTSGQPAYSGLNSNSGASTASGSTGQGKGGGGGLHLAFLSLSSSSSRIFLPLVLLLGLLALVLGGFMLFSPAFREQLIGFGHTLSQFGRRLRERLQGSSRAEPERFTKTQAWRKW
jgi:hypothetical protein